MDFNPTLLLQRFSYCFVINKLDIMIFSEGYATLLVFNVHAIATTTSKKTVMRSVLR